MTGLPVRRVQADFFTRFGLYVEKQFLEPDWCARLSAEMQAVSGKPATVAEGTAGDAVDEEHRRTKLAQVSHDSSTLVRVRLLAAKPRLAAHFGRELSGLQKPQFLAYREGDFFRPHPDTSDEPAEAAYVRERAVSTVIFINGETDAPGPSGYGGGALAFFGLMAEDGRGDKVGLPLTGETGLLVAFPSELVHGVQAVTRGERYTIASWFI